jgi:hypothetical protein
MSLRGDTMPTYRVELKPYIDVWAEDDLWADKFYRLDPDEFLPKVRGIEVIDA